MMRKILYVWLLLALLPLCAMAQSSMTDSQIMDYIVRENAKGTSRSQIVVKLMERGVTVDRIRKIRSNYEKQQKKSVPGAIDISGYDKKKEDRLRRNNGDTRKNTGEGDARNYTNRRKAYELSDDGDLEERQRFLKKEEQVDEMSEELDFVLPDSMELYRDVMEAKSRRKIGKEVFGRNIFSNKKLTFESDMNIATPAGYVLGPGDAVYVDVWGASQKNYEATVSPDGNIDLDGYGPVHVGGLTVAQANRRLKETLGTRFSSSNVRLTVGQTKTISVNVMGEVNHPGTYTLSAFSTVFHALYMAGGTNEIGTLRNIKVYRNGRCISTVDIYDYILNGKMSGNVKLAAGDVIIVEPYECLVQITGKVRRPMWYEMSNTESVGTLIKYAGGFTGEAYQGNVTLIRKAGGQYSVYSLDEFERNGFQLRDADSVFVDSTLNRYVNMVEVKGAVFRPGKYQMDGSITTVRQLLEAAGGPTENAIIEHAIMHRRKEDRMFEVLSVDVKGLMEHTVPDIPLRNEDVLFVPDKQELQRELTLEIRGEVKYPGTYEYAENMTLEDFVLMAGGLTDAASTVKVDVARRVRNNKATSAEDHTARSYSFALKNNFVLQGEQGFVLEPFDEVYVRKSPGYVEQSHVTVEGEIAFSGEYVLTRKGFRLSDLVKAAGGLTSEAYASGARLERKLTVAEKNSQQTMLKLISAGDSANLAKIEIGDVKSVGINLDMALLHPGDNRWDIVLREGDRLVIPQYNNTVSINGEVTYPNTVAYVEGKGLDYYINQAGGYGQRAKKSRVIAINMNGTVTKVKSKKDIRPGATILIPSKARKRGLSFGEIISLSTMGVSLSAVLATLFK